MPSSSSSNRPAPGFRLNAPQAESEVEQMGDHSSGAFGGLGDELEGMEDLNDVNNDDPGFTSIKPPFVMPQRGGSNNSNNNKGMMMGSSYSQQQQQQQLQQQHPSSPEEPRGLPLKCLIAVGVFVILLLIGLIVAVIMTLGDDGSNSSSSNSAPNTNLAPNPAPTVPTIPTLPPRPANTDAPTGPPIEQEPTPAPKTVLGRVYQRGYLLCGVSDSQPGFSELNFETGIREGFDVEMCYAIAGAIFGQGEGEEEDSIYNRVEFVLVTAFDRFQQLADGNFDVLSRTTTHTMERHVKEATTGTSFSFSVPYLYNGLQFAGDPFHVECADNFTVSTDDGLCQDTKICALDGTTHVDEILAKMPNAQILSVVGSEFLYTNFIQGLCNVIAGEQFDIAESIVRQRGYVGDYAYGTKVHSKEPLCLVTRDDDPEWSDFVNWVLQALLSAEDESITQQTANIIGPTTVFGETSPFALAFRNAVLQVGNYGEMYRRTLEALLPRPIPDRINGGDSGLIYSYPFGNGSREVGNDGAGGMLEEIRTRGFLKCGISRRVIFAQFDTTTQTWDGFDVDFCKAISAAMGLNETSIVYTDLAASERFHALQNGTVDVLSRLTTVTMSRDINEPDTGVGFSFSQPNFYDGLLFGGIPPFAGCADRLDITSVSCQDLLICVNEGTTFETRLKTLFPERFIIPRQSGEFMVEGLVTGECNVIAGGVVDVSLTSIRLAGYDGSYQTGSSRYSKDPLALVTRQDDPQWSKFVYWIVAGIFYAEEEGIDQSNAASLMPEVTLFGSMYSNMLIDAVGAVGNYGEIYSRQAQADVPRGGLNEVNELLSGPQHYPLPGVV